MTMATVDPISDITTTSARPDNGLLVLLAAMTPEQLERVLANLTASFPAEDLLIASPDAVSDALPTDSYPSLRIVAAPAANASWTLTAADFVSAYQLASKDKARAILMLSPESGSLSSSAISALANAVLTTPTDLAVASYDFPSPSISASRFAWPNASPALPSASPSSTRESPLSGRSTKPQ